MAYRHDSVDTLYVYEIETLKVVAELQGPCSKIERFARDTYDKNDRLGWSYYPLAAGSTGALISDETTQKIKFT